MSSSFFQDSLIQNILYRCSYMSIVSVFNNQLAPFNHYILKTGISVATGSVIIWEPRYSGRHGGDRTRRGEAVAVTHSHSSSATPRLCCCDADPRRIAITSSSSSSGVTAGCQCRAVVAHNLLTVSATFYKDERRFFRTSSSEEYSHVNSMTIRMGYSNI